ncbi:hypothetical protein LCGC14_2603440 [marine sediment metagenome]|uniref:Uncharacterized protein n=1 Tax=marine sediment metagenome TaxID=412755 RepID=A0A0F9A8E9_9ZZZZ
MPPRYRKRPPTKQHYPSWVRLLARIDAGFHPLKEVTKRIRSGEVPAEDESPEQFEAYEQVIMLLGVKR